MNKEHAELQSSRKWEKKKTKNNIEKKSRRGRSKSRLSKKLSKRKEKINWPIRVFDVCIL
jgi:hypothetical protein